jgi:hypothetical protein
VLILGIGGAAGRVLSHYRKLIRDQFGGAQMPAVQLLLLDTDPRARSEAVRRSDATLTPDETLNLSLRRPQHYRDHAQQLLTWLSRRWLYNIPRSLRTEGLRPLGRLALADHARQAGQRIRGAMMQAIGPQSTAATQQVMRRNFRSDAIRVYVVASISGGTGGGMALDIGYAVRAILNKLGVANARVCGLMMHSTGGDPRHCELARVNALSWLTEFHHFQQADNAYPGDASCGLPAHPPGTPAFDDTYLIHLGENLNEIEFDQATQSVAEYLRLNTVTPGAAFFESGRAGAADRGSRAPSGGNGRTLRSFGLFQRTAAPSEFCDELAGIVSQRVIAAWQDESVKAECTSDSMLVRRLQLDANGIAGNTRTMLELELGGDATAFLSKWLATQTGGAESGRLDVIDRLFGRSDPQDSAQCEYTLQGRPIATSIAPLAEKLRKDLHRWFAAQVDDRHLRVSGASKQLGWLLEHCSAVESELRRAREIVSNNLLALHRESASLPATTNANGSITSEAWQQMLTCFCLRLDQAAILAAEHIVHLLIEDAQGMVDEVSALGRDLDQIARAISRACSDTKTDISSQTTADTATSEPRITHHVQARLPQIIDEVDARLQAEHLTPLGGLLRVIRSGGRPRAQLTAKLHELARQVVQRAVAEINVLDTNGSGGANASDLQCGLSVATPTLLEFGGTRQVLAVLPKISFDSASKALSSSLGAPVTAIPGCDNNVMLCVEADGLSIQHIAAAFVEHRRDRVEFAGRVHCRTDISWMPLIDTAAASAPFDWSVGSDSASSRDAACKTVVL